MPHHAVLALDQLVGKASRPLVAEEDGAPFSLAALLALASSEVGATLLVSTLKVLAILSLPTSEVQTL
jgi:hypothetical protein